MTSLASMLKAAFEQAGLARQSWVGPEHVILAVLKEPSAATQALGEIGLTYDRLFELVRSARIDPQIPPRGSIDHPRANPSFYKVEGWAYGYAASRGREPEASDWLLAAVYFENMAAGYLERVGITGSDVVTALARRGIEVPSLDPPTYKPWRGHRRVDVTDIELPAILHALGERFPPGSEWQWGFNVAADDPKRAWVVSEDGIDLEAIVAEVRRLESPSD